MAQRIMIRCERVEKTFQTGGLFGSRGSVEAVANITFAVREGDSLGIVGESGSGKTTIARLLCGLEAPSGGTIHILGTEQSVGLRRKERLGRARAVQMVFQDPYSSLDPQQTLVEALDEIQRVHFDRGRKERMVRSMALLEDVGLGNREGTVLPRALSGGQRQRAAIARALAVEPKLLILDEAVSALDVSVQAQILNLLADLRREFGLTYVVISHDLGVIRHLCDEALVVYRGRVVERGPAATVLNAPRHPYTELLRQAIPNPEMRLRQTVRSVEGSVTGCRFRERCPIAVPQCSVEPELLPTDERHHDARCWFAADMPIAVRKEDAGELDGA